MNNNSELEITKAVAGDALLEGQVMLATLILTEAMSLKAALKELAGPVVPKVGDILCSSWGYEQTNIDFYEVVGVTKASVKIVKISKRLVGTTGYSNSVVPNPGTFLSTKPMTKRVRISDDSYSVNIESYASASLWDGTPENETAGGYGH